jgi:phosphohistidine phosphatase SixA
VPCNTLLRKRDSWGGMFHKHVLIVEIGTLFSNHLWCTGQYMHYLIKWAFALNRVALVTHEPRYNELAIQLIKGESDGLW